MRILKIILSAMALLLSAAAGVLTSGAPVQVSPQTLSLVAAIAGALSILGISPIQLDPAISRVLSALALVMAAVVGWHAGVVTGADNPHPWAWAAFAFAGAVVGVMGKSPIPHSPAAVPAVSPPATP